jgi:hypothetical protein
MLVDAAENGRAGLGVTGLLVVAAWWLLWWAWETERQAKGRVILANDLLALGSAEDEPRYRSRRPILKIVHGPSRRPSGHRTGFTPERGAD